ncbi:MAG: polyphosphate kinase 1 [Acidimicrobiia bacterium]|nr:polyphosphate kinase 1 [Acidimicrobiia bacterium]
MSDRFINRELSLLDFQSRVLALAENPRLPLLERVKFVAIVSQNLDEFFQVRVAGLINQAATSRKAGPDGMTPTQQLTAIREAVLDLHHRTDRAFLDELLPQLADAGVRLADWNELDNGDRAHLNQIFEDELFPVLTPLAVDPSHPFPFISNLSLNLAVILSSSTSGGVRFARVKVPPILDRFITLPDGERIVPLEQVIRANLGRLFGGEEIVEDYVFRVTRSADFAVEEEEAEDLLEAMESVLRFRQRAAEAVRLEVSQRMTPEVLDLLLRELGLDESAVYVRETTLDLGGLWQLYALDRPELKDPPWSPTTQPRLQKHANDPEIDFFSLLAERDLFVHHPYESFGTSTGAFLAQAAGDPNVLAIKQTLYRTSVQEDPAIGGEEQVVQSLIEAADSGKQVVVLVELKARFDEAANIKWAKMLENAGAHVVYGVAGLKTHSKTLLVVRREAAGIRRYAHIGTGNYNPKTARIYEDAGLFTADPDIGADLSELFNSLTGHSRSGEYRKLLVAPAGLRPGLIAGIEGEAAKGGDGRILFKCNHIVDTQIIEALYAASAAGCRVDLIVRGNCSIRAGVPGLSENITIRSIVGKYLEHSRFYRFGHPIDDATYYLGSADLMQRNLSGRVEVLTPVEDPHLKGRIEEILVTLQSDSELAWEMIDEGRAWRRAEATTPAVNAHEELERLALERAAH